MTIVWEWGSDFDLLVENCEKYVSLNWQEDTRECAILLHGIERTEGVTYTLVGYTKNRGNVTEIASKLLEAALGTKIWYCSLDLSEREFFRGIDVLYREEELPEKVKLLEDKVKQKLLERDKNLANKAKETQKELVVDWALYLGCAVRNPEAIYVVDCHDSVLEIILHEMKRLASSLGEVVGFSLDERVEDPVVIDSDEDENRIYVVAIERSQLKA